MLPIIIEETRCSRQPR